MGGPPEMKAGGKEIAPVGDMAKPPEEEVGVPTTERGRNLLSQLRVRMEAETLFDKCQEQNQTIRELFKISALLMVLGNASQYPGYQLLEALFSMRSQLVMI